MLYEGGFIYKREKKLRYHIHSTSKNADELLSVGTKCQSQSKF